MFDPAATRHLHIEFRTVAVENRAKSLKEGRPIFDQQEQVFIRFAGDTKKELVAPAHEKCMRDPATGLWVSYAQVYHRHYEAFKSGEAAIGEGTPVEELPFLDTARRAELKALHIHTAEALAGLEGPNLSRLGMFGRELKEKARAYIDKARDSALEIRLAAENAALTQRIAALETQLLAERAPAPPPSPQDRTAVDETDIAAAATPFDGWPDADLKAFIKEQTGQAPRGAPSHEKLVELAGQAHDKAAA
ncbi:MAG: hypothetical protein AB7F74_15185 [Parvibaculaceae bacterium]